MKQNVKNLPTLMPYNIDWAKFFNNDNPIDLEIGFGRTHFLFDRAKNFSSRNIVGIEWKYEHVLPARRRVIREQINNAIVLHGNAWQLVPTLFARASISAVFI